MQILDLKQSYFELFELDLTFEIDLKRLSSAQQRLQAVYHPDRFVNASEQDKRLSVQQASWINEAFETLSKPVKRARYMLELSGLELNDESETTSDTTFLMEQIALREEIEECRTNADPPGCCDHIMDKLRSKADQFGSEFIANFDQGQLDDARISSRKMQFIQRILEQLIDFQLELEEG
ncbi:co-chaperone protein HscB [bacterium MnTg03]|nr:co-chaperone protein HscB [bacterium MnTg03]